MWPTAEPDLFDREEKRRVDPQFLEVAWQDPRRRVVHVHEGHVAYDQPVESDATDAIFLGTAQGVAWFAVRSRTAQAQDLRTTAHRLSDVERSAALTATALDNWHAAHEHCPRCGQPTEIVRAGWVRRCLTDGSEHFPRTDPAVIVLVIDDQDRALLGRRAIWPAGWFSTLAGFVEPGETFEQAVVREVAEESGVRVPVASVAYRTTQPWPFPSSIMIAFTAPTHSQPTVPDGEEIAETIWVSRDDFRAAAEAGTLRIPPRISVAHHLIADWFGEPVPYTWSR